MLILRYVRPRPHGKGVRGIAGIAGDINDLLKVRFGRLIVNKSPVDKDKPRIWSYLLVNSRKRVVARMSFVGLKNAQGKAELRIFAKKDAFIIPIKTKKYKGWFRISPDKLKKVIGVKEKRVGKVCS